MLMKIATHVVVFGIGALGGIYWGVHNPVQAQSIADREQEQAARIQAAIAQGRQQALQQVVTDQNNGTLPAASPSVSDHYKQMLQSAQQQFNTAKAKIGK